MPELSEAEVGALGRAPGRPAAGGAWGRSGALGRAPGRPAAGGARGRSGALAAAWWLLGLLLVAGVVGAPPAEARGEGLHTSGLSAEMPRGIGGFIGGGSACPGDEERPAWRALARIDRRLDAFLAEDAKLVLTQSRQVAALERRVAEARELEARLVGVVHFGCAASGVTALTRIGELYEAQSAWLLALPFPLDVAWLPVDPLYTPACPDDSQRQRVVAAYELALHKGYEADLHGYPPVRFALARLRVLAPEAYPESWEIVAGAAPGREPARALPADGAEAGGSSPTR